MISLTWVDWITLALRGSAFFLSGDFSLSINFRIPSPLQNALRLQAFLGLGKRPQHAAA